MTKKESVESSSGYGSSYDDEEDMEEGMEEINDDSEELGGTIKRVDAPVGKMSDNFQSESDEESASSDAKLEAKMDAQAAKNKESESEEVD